MKKEKKANNDGIEKIKSVEYLQRTKVNVVVVVVAA